VAGENSDCEKKALTNTERRPRAAWRETKHCYGKSFEEIGAKKGDGKKGCKGTSKITKFFIETTIGKNRDHPRKSVMIRRSQLREGSAASQKNKQKTRSREDAARERTTM